MKESCERTVRVGFTRNPTKVFDEIDQVTAAMIRDGWSAAGSCLEDGLGLVHLFFEREIASGSGCDSLQREAV